MLNRSLTMLCLSLMRVSGWQMAPLPVPHGHAQCAISQTTARQAVAPQMCSYDHLSSEFQVCARHATQHRSSPASLSAAPLPSQRLANQRTGTVFGEPRSLLRQHKADSAWVLLFNPGERTEGVYTLQGRETPGAPHGTYVLAFEEQEEASRFAMLLQVRRASSCGPLASVPGSHPSLTHAVTSPAQAQGFDLAFATKWTSELLGDFCDTADFDLGFVPDAALLIPPEQNFFVADAPEHEPQSNKDVLLGDAERDSEVTAALLRPPMRSVSTPLSTGSPPV
jgi:hypothetical protein